MTLLSDHTDEHHAHGYERDYDHGGGDDHDHDHDHAVGHDHDHSHRSGITGWLQHTFAHSHDAHEKVDDAMATHERGIWALKISFLILGATAIFQVIIVYFTGSTALLADTIHNFGDAATSIPLWIAFALVRRGQTRQFTYGYGRAEDFAGVIIVLLIFLSACVAGYESIMKLFDPKPVQHLPWVAAAAIIGFIGNEAVAIFRIRVGTQIGSAALIADGQHSRVDGFTSLAVLVGVAGVAMGVPILDPIVGLLITIAILFIVKDAARSIFHRMLDGIDPAIMEQIEHAPFHVSGVQEVHQARARWHGHKVLVDLHITVDPALTVSDAHEITNSVDRALARHVKAFGSATIHVCPAQPEPFAIEAAA